MNEESARAQREKRLLGAILEWPDLLDHVDERFFSLNFTVDSLNPIRDVIQTVYISRKSVDKQALHAHIEAEGLSSPMRQVLAGKSTLRTLLGGAEADLVKRAALWKELADTHEGQNQTDAAKTDELNRMAEALRSGNSEAMKRLMRAGKASQK